MSLVASRWDLIWALACLQPFGPDIAAAEPLLDHLGWSAAERAELAAGLTRLLSDPATPEEWVAHDAVALGRGLPVGSWITPMGVRSAGDREAVPPRSEGSPTAARQTVICDLADRVMELLRCRRDRSGLGSGRVAAGTSASARPRR
ncbi:hypothetical protein [Actinopolymorpha alba]|uniref:hypothetical protein n=1 Tax=Actinopolymorpha alba TaxID=533267 RepID=UPI00036EB761|nr:hypothetical protein [Actinopolymorpha alba]